MDKARAVGRAAVIRLLMQGLERRLEESATAAEGVSGPVADKLNDALGFVHQAHDKLNEAAALAATHYGEPDVTVFSGGTGEGKEEDGG